MPAGTAAAAADTTAIQCPGTTLHRLQRQCSRRFARTQVQDVTLSGYLAGAAVAAARAGRPLAATGADLAAALREGWDCDHTCQRQASTT